VAEEGRRLILVRHSLPEYVTGVPASQWRLSAEGRRRCEQLAGQLAGHHPATIITSKEAKALETGQIVAEVLGLPLESVEDLHEHERGAVTDLGGQDEFRAQVAHLLEQPGELVMGYETADQAHARFAAAVARVVAQHPSGNVAIVSHGTVMTLFVARANQVDPVPLWRSLGLPAFVVLSLPGMDLLEVVESV
jgi:broad specificity phosphatase PhoE